MSDLPWHQRFRNNSVLCISDLPWYQSYRNNSVLCISDLPWYQGYNTILYYVFLTFLGIKVIMQFCNMYV